MSNQTPAFEIDNRVAIFVNHELVESLGDLVVENNDTAFEIDSRIAVTIERELASALGCLILETNTKNTALLALGHQLRSAINVGRSDASMS